MAVRKISGLLAVWLAVAVSAVNGTEYGLAPAHIAADNNVLLRQPEKWDTVWRRLAWYKIYDVQLRNVPWATPVDPGALADFLRRSSCRLGLEYGTFFGHGDGRAVARDIIANLAPLEKAGIRLYSLHLDGAVVRMLRGVGSPPNPGAPCRYELPRVAAEMAALYGELRRHDPALRIGLVPNLMNWDWSEEVPGALGQWSRESGVRYRDALEAIRLALLRNGDKIDFIEVDAPYNYYILAASPLTGRKFDGPALLREVQAWCRERGIAFRLIVNCEPRTPFGDFAATASTGEMRQGAARFREGALAYLARLRPDGIEPDGVIFQSWYRTPSTLLPLAEPLSFTGIAAALLDAAAAGPKQGSVDRGFGGIR